MRGRIISLFITSLKPYKPVSKDTVKWIRSILAAAGMDLKLFTPHSTQSASNSKVRLHKPIETVLKTGGGPEMLAGYFIVQISI